MLIRSPFEDLIEEHVALIGEMRDLLNEIKELPSSDKEMIENDLNLLRSSLELMQYRMRIHFRKEEEGLFPESKRIISEGTEGADIFGPFFAEEAEDDMGAHAALAQRINEMLNITNELDNLGALDDPAFRKLSAVGAAAEGLLKRHAEKEEALIFPLLERSLTPVQIGQVGERLEKLGSARDLTGGYSEEGISRLGG